MIALTAGEVAAVTGGTLHLLDAATLVAGPVVTDARDVVPGALFVAVGHDDGHAAGAVAAGACAILSARPPVADDALPAVVVPDVLAALAALAREVLARLREAACEPGGSGLQVVAVTGSAGATGDLLVQVLGAAGPAVAPVRGVTDEIGVPLTVLRADEDTRALVLELGTGHVAALTDVAPPDVAVVLAGAVETAAASALVTGLTPGGVAVLDGDDARVSELAAIAPDEAVTFGLSSGAQVRAADVRLAEGGHPAFTLVDARRGEPRSVPVRLRLVGEHHVRDALAAAAAALVVGLDLDAVAEHLAAADALSPHRMHVVDRPDGVTVVDDSYEADPSSMRAALKALAALAGRDRRSVAVLGEMLELGPERRTAHDAIGRLAVRLDIGLTVVVGDGARAIADGAAHEGSWGDEVMVVEDVDAAATLLAGELRPGDVVLVKSSYDAGLWRLGDRLAEVGA